jgi:hypothetical protein
MKNIRPSRCKSSLWCGIRSQRLHPRRTERPTQILLLLAQNPHALVNRFDLGVPLCIPSFKLRVFHLHSIDEGSFVCMTDLPQEMRAVQHGAAVTASFAADIAALPAFPGTERCMSAPARRPSSAATPALHLEARRSWAQAALHAWLLSEPPTATKRQLDSRGADTRHTAALVSAMHSDHLSPTQRPSRIPQLGGSAA